MKLSNKEIARLLEFHYVNLIEEIKDPAGTSEKTISNTNQRIQELLEQVNYDW